MIPNIFEYFKDKRPGTYASTAVIHGKGPSFKPTDYKKYPDPFLHVSINETARYVEADINFFIDLECYRNCKFSSHFWNRNIIFMPAKPHLKHNPIILAPEERPRNLYCFDLARPSGYDINFIREKETNEYPEYEPLIAISNTFEAVFHMLCLYNFKVIKSYGIDGGTEYHPLFQTKEKLRSNNPNLTQFETVAKFCEKYGVTYEKL